MRIAAYFLGWLLALPGLCLAGFMLAVGRAISLGNPFMIAWEALLAFAYGLPLVVLVGLVVCILAFFRSGRMIGAAALLVAALGTLAVVIEIAGAPKGVEQALFFVPTVAAAILAGWLLQAEARADSPSAATATDARG